MNGRGRSFVTFSAKKHEVSKNTADKSISKRHVSSASGRSAEAGRTDGRTDTHRPNLLIKSVQRDKICTQYAPTMTNGGGRSQSGWAGDNKRPSTRSIPRQSSPIHSPPSPLLSRLPPSLALFLNGKIVSNRTNIIGRRQHLSELENAGAMRSVTTHLDLHDFKESCNAQNKSENFAPSATIIVRLRQSDRIGGGERVLLLGKQQP